MLEVNVKLNLLAICREDMEAVLARVEWSTLLFFAALFVLMEALSELGLIDWIGQQTVAVITSVHSDYQLCVAILIILWVRLLQIVAFVSRCSNVS